jgi:hypothetical protein
MNEQTEYYLNRAKNGDREAAFCGLIELPRHLLPDLEDAYRDEADPLIRALIVHAVWQHRLPSSVGFLAAALEDPRPDVWKEALDGLVTLASAESRQVLELAKHRAGEQDETLRAWIEEAIEQVDELITPVIFA